MDNYSKLQIDSKVPSSLSKLSISFPIVGQSLNHVGLVGLSPNGLHHLVEVDVDAHDEEGEPHAQAEEHVHQNVLVSLTIHSEQI